MLSSLTHFDVRNTWALVSPWNDTAYSGEKVKGENLSKLERNAAQHSSTTHKTSGRGPVI